MDNWTIFGGIYIALGCVQDIDQVQIGADQAGRKKKRGAPLNAREDAMDGSLEGNTLHVGPVDAGIRIDTGISGHSATVLISVAGSAAEAASIVTRAKASGIEDLEERAKALWDPMVRQIFIPAAASRIERKLACRSLLNLLIGRDQDSGAFVASPSRQPHYCYDWPRDGAFYDMALDLAGLSTLVDDHLAFYGRTQRRAPVAFSPTWLSSFRFPFFIPRGHWFSNMNTDGSPGFFRLIPIEIDETSLVVWDIWRHSRYVPASQKDSYRAAYQETVELAVDAIMRFVDLKKGWTKKIMEDDDHIPKATLHGASAVLTALASASDLGRQWGINGEKVSEWQRAAEVLRHGILGRVEDSEVLVAAGWRGIQWSLFPAPLFEDYSHPAAKTILRRLSKVMEETISRKNSAFAYLGEQLFIFSVSTQGMPQYEDLKIRILEFLTVTAPVEGGDCYGEVGLWREIGEQSEFIIQNRTSIPHLWTGITVYLAIVAMYRPELIVSLRPPIPA